MFSDADGQKAKYKCPRAKSYPFSTFLSLFHNRSSVSLLEQCYCHIKSLHVFPYGEIKGFFQALQIRVKAGSHLHFWATSSFCATFHPHLQYIMKNTGKCQHCKSNPDQYPGPVQESNWQKEEYLLLSKIRAVNADLKRLCFSPYKKALDEINSRHVCRRDILGNNSPPFLTCPQFTLTVIPEDCREKNIGDVLLKGLELQFTYAVSYWQWTNSLHWFLTCFVWAMTYPNFHAANYHVYNVNRC